MKKELIFIGPPGSGKGTQTKMLSEEYNLPHIDTGAMLREEIASGSEQGKIAESLISKGRLVPLELVASIIKNRLMQEDCKNGFILDGYPRSIEQAYALDDILKEIDKDSPVVPKVIYFNVDEEKLIDRLVNRRTCEKCGEIYNLKSMKLRDENVCEKCGGKLIKRSDDTEETARKRFDTYFKETEPVTDIYRKRGQLITLDASLSIDEMYKNLKGAIN